MPAAAGGQSRARAPDKSGLADDGDFARARTGETGLGNRRPRVDDGPAPRFGVTGSCRARRRGQFVPESQGVKAVTGGKAAAAAVDGCPCCRGTKERKIKPTGDLSMEEGPGKPGTQWFKITFGGDQRQGPFSRSASVAWRCGRWNPWPCCMAALPWHAVGRMMARRALLTRARNIPGLCLAAFSCPPLELSALLRVSGPLRPCLASLSRPYQGSRRRGRPHGCPDPSAPAQSRPQARAGRCDREASTPSRRQPPGPPPATPHQGLAWPGQALSRHLPPTCFVAFVASPVPPVRTTASC